MPWRNGGGTTTELVLGPERAGRFLYRVSIADVATNGPFSRFAGYERHIMLIEGAGMTLDCQAHGRIELAARFEPRAFSGDWEVHGTLVAGAVRDFNLIVDRERASSSPHVRVLTAPETLTVAPGAICIVHLLDGADAGDTLVADAPFELAPRGTTRVAVATVTPR